MTDPKPSEYGSIPPKKPKPTPPSEYAAAPPKPTPPSEYAAAPPKPYGSIPQPKNANVKTQYSPMPMPPNEATQQTTKSKSVIKNLVASIRNALSAKNKTTHDVTNTPPLNRTVSKNHNKGDGISR